jgi:hypothetical protein
MLLEFFLKRVIASFLVVVFVLGVAVFPKSVSSDEFKVFVRIIGKSGVMFDQEVSFTKASFVDSEGNKREVGRTALGALVYALSSKGLGYEIQTYDSFQDKKTYYVKSIGGAKNWLYSINEWTPFCLASNDYDLRNGERVDFYEISYQGLPYSRISMGQSIFSEGDKISLKVQKKDYQGNCDNSRGTKSWEKLSGVSVIIEDSQKGVRAFQSDNLGEINLSSLPKGYYKAWIEDVSYFPSGKVSFEVLEAKNQEQSGQYEEGTIKRENGENKQEENFLVNNNSLSLKNETGLKSNEKREVGEQLKESIGLKEEEKNKEGGLIREEELNGSRLDIYAYGASSDGNDLAESDFEFLNGLEVNFEKKENSLKEGVVLGQIDLGKAVNFLLSQQSEDGNIGGASFSSWVLMALYNQGVSQSSEFLKLQEFLEKSIEVGNNLEILEIEKNILVFNVLGKDVENIGGRNLEQIFFSNFTEGQIGEKDRLNDDIWGLIVLKNLGFENSHELVFQEVEYLKSQQGEDGGFSFMVGGKSDVDDTVFALLALKLAGMDEREEVFQKGFKFIENHRNADGGYSSFEEGKSSGTTSLLVFLLLDEFQKEVPFTLIDFIYSLQREDGAFGEYQDEEVNPLFTTVFGVLALSSRGYPLRMQSFKELFEDDETEVLAGEDLPFLEEKELGRSASKDDLIMELMEENRKVFERFNRLVKYLLVSVLAFEVVVFWVLVYFVASSLKTIRQRRR